MTEKDVLKLFETHKALLTGHFKLSSGLHSEKYLQCAILLQYPDIAEKLAKALAAKFSKDRIDLVIGPALGGVTIAYEVARALGVRGIFAERQPQAPVGEAGRMTIRRGFSVKAGERVLVAEDVITTGGSTREVMKAARDAGGIVAGVGAIIDRSSGGPEFGVPFKSLAALKIEAFAEDKCPLCKKGIPAVKPGSGR